MAQNTTKSVTSVRLFHGYFYSFRDGHSKTSGCIWIQSSKMTSYFSLVAWRCKNLCAICFHNRFTIWLLFVADFNHKYLQVQPKMLAGNTQGTSPLAGTGFCCHVLDSLYFIVVGLRYGRV